MACRHSPYSGQRACVRASGICSTSPGSRRRRVAISRSQSDCRRAGGAGTSSVAASTVPLTLRLRMASPLQ